MVENCESMAAIIAFTTVCAGRIGVTNFIQPCANDTPANIDVAMCPGSTSVVRTFGALYLLFIGKSNF